jgi:hypothetical protein
MTKSLLAKVVVALMTAATAAVAVYALAAPYPSAG